MKPRTTAFRACRLLTLAVAVFCITLSLYGFRRSVTLTISPRHTLLLTNLRVEYVFRDGTDGGYPQRIAQFTSPTSRWLSSRVQSPQLSSILLPYQDSGPGWRRIGVPFLYITAAAISLAILFWWNDLKKLHAFLSTPIGKCTCGYSRAGLEPDDPCPECGTRQ
jgi:hypothetical protein